jgi:hypothetical protein
MNKVVLNAFDASGDKRLLTEILKQFETSKDLNWSIVFFEGIASFPKNATHDDFMKEVTEKPHGISMSYAELIGFSEKISDIADLLLVGYYNPPIFEKRLVLDGFYEGCAIVIELFDSTKWTILS